MHQTAVRACWIKTGGSPVAANRECIDNSHWDNERAEHTDTVGYIPLPGVSIKLYRPGTHPNDCLIPGPVCRFSTTEDDGYAVFPDLDEGIWFFKYTSMTERVNGSCVGPGFLWRQCRCQARFTHTTSPATQSSHIGVLHFVTKDCDGGYVTLLLHTLTSLPYRLYLSLKSPR